MVKLADGAQAQQKKATRAAYGATLAELASEGVPVVAVDADLTGSTTTKKLADAGFADRLFNCGIAEQNMVDVAAGLAITGHVAFTGSFAVFGTGRAYDQIRNTVCYSNLDVKIAPTHAGISVGPDGGSHQMLEDVALMRVLPNMRVLVPADYAAARAAIRLAAETPGPVYVRMGRASVPCVYADDVELELGRAYVLREGGDATIVACGVEVEQALKAAELLEDAGIAFSVRVSEVDVLGEAARRGDDPRLRGQDGLRGSCRGAQRDGGPRLGRGRDAGAHLPGTGRVRGHARRLRQIGRVRRADGVLQPGCGGDCRSCEEGYGPKASLIESSRLSTSLFERSIL